MPSLCLKNRVLSAAHARDVDMIGPVVPVCYDAENLCRRATQRAALQWMLAKPTQLLQAKRSLSELRAGSASVTSGDDLHSAAPNDASVYELFPGSNTTTRSTHAAGSGATPAGRPPKAPAPPMLNTRALHGKRAHKLPSPSHAAARGKMHAHTVASVCGGSPRAMRRGRGVTSA